MSETIVGTCASIIEKTSGWYEFEIMAPGKQYPVRLATKKQELVELARAAHSDTMTWTYNETESDKINEHTGRPFVNRYLEGVEAGAAVPAGVSSPEPHHEPMHFADKDRAITRMACLKAAAQVYAGLGVEEARGTPDLDAGLTVMKSADRFERWVMRDIDDVPFA